MEAIEKWAIEAAVAIVVVGILVCYFIFHERHEGAQACVQATTETKQVASAHVEVDEGAQHSDIKTEVDSYAQKLQSLQSDNADLSNRLSNALREKPMHSAGPAAANCAADPGLRDSESKAQERSRQLGADISAVLDACDANQVKVEDANSIYNGVRARALATASQSR